MLEVGEGATRGLLEVGVSEVFEELGLESDPVADPCRFGIGEEEGSDPVEGLAREEVDDKRNLGRI